VLMIEIMVIVILDLVKCEAECSDYFMFVLKPILSVKNYFIRFISLPVSIYDVT